MVSGCASQSAIDSVRDDLTKQMDTISANADEALREARSARQLSQQANARASEASKEANEAAAMAEDANSKLNRMFKKIHDEINFTLSGIKGPYGYAVRAFFI